MGRETEKIFMEFKEYLKNKEISTEEEYEEEFSKFINMKNTKVMQKKQNDPWDYLDMAYEADSEQEALKYAKRALKLDANCLDAECMILELTTEDPEKLKRKYEELIVKTEKHLKKEDILKDENIGHFWGIVETRPYMRLRHSYINLLIDLGKFKKAIKECEELLLFSESDNLGVRYILISLYSFFEDQVNVKKLYRRYDKELTSQMLLPIIALYYKLDNYEKAELYLNKLSLVNKELEEVFCNTEGIDDIMEANDFIDSGMYRYGSKEEIMVAMANSSFLYSTTAGFFIWIADNIVKQSVKIK